jgi:hypothetical protein
MCLLASQLAATTLLWHKLVRLNQFLIAPHCPGRNVKTLEGSQIEKNHPRFFIEEKK